MRAKDKTLVVTTEKRFSLNHEGKIINEDNTRSRSFWERYLKLFDKVIVVARVDVKSILDNNNFVECDRIKVHKLTNYKGLIQGVLNYSKLQIELKTLVKKYTNSSYLLRVPGTVGNQLAGVLMKKKLKYSLEVVGDPFEVYITQSNILHKALAYKERLNLRRLVKNAHSVAYVTQHSLQERYPFTNGFQTYYSSIKLEDRFFIDNKVFSSKPLIMVGVGSLEMPYKGVSVLLEALKMLNQSGIDFKMTWIGGGKLLDDYTHFVEINNLKKKVFFLGAVSNDVIPSYLNKHNIFILPSLTEGLPRAIIEAMASRLICLGSNVGGIPELLDDRCLFEPNNPIAIVNKLKDVNTNFSSYKSYSDINFNKAMEYVPEVLAKRRFAFLQSIETN